MEASCESPTWGYLIPDKGCIIDLRKERQIIILSEVKLFCVTRHDGGKAKFSPLCAACYINNTQVKAHNWLADGTVITIRTKGGLKGYRFVARSKRHEILQVTSLHEKYILGEKLGEGGFGEVFKMYEKKTGRPYAVKKQRMYSEDDYPIREVEILLKMQHPCVIRMYDIKYGCSAMYIVLEYMAGGDLTCFVNSSGPKINESQMKLIFYQIVVAVKYLHKSGICHRDLKPANILLRDKQPHTLVKVSDLGLAKSEIMHSPMTSVCGTLIYMAPEIMRGWWKGGAYDKKVDVWSLGVILYQGLSGKLPEGYGGAISFPPQQWSRFPDALRLIRGMLQKRPQRRMKIAQVHGSDWLKDNETRMAASSLMTQSNKVGNKKVKQIPEARALQGTSPAKRETPPKLQKPFKEQQAQQGVPQVAKTVQAPKSKCEERQVNQKFQQTDVSVIKKPVAFIKPMDPHNARVGQQSSPQKKEILRNIDDVYNTAYESSYNKNKETITTEYNHSDDYDSYDYDAYWKSEYGNRHYSPGYYSSPNYNVCTTEKDSTLSTLVKIGLFVGAMYFLGSALMKQK